MPGRTLDHVVVLMASAFFDPSLRARASLCSPLNTVCGSSNVSTARLFAGTNANAALEPVPKNDHIVDALS